MADRVPLISCICTGNSCRSPMAEKLLQHALDAEDQPWSSFRVISAGISAPKGAPATSHAISALKKVGIESRKDLETFFGKQIHIELFVKVNKNWRSNHKQLKRFGYK